jgi:hypothetical protein
MVYVPFLSRHSNSTGISSGGGALVLNSESRLVRDDINGLLWEVNYQIIYIVILFLII